MTDSIIQKYKKYLPCEWSPSRDQYRTLQSLYRFSLQMQSPIRSDHSLVLIEAVNQKLSLNAQCYKKILDVAYSEGIKLNYIIKSKIKYYLDSSDMDAYLLLFHELGCDSDAVRAAFQPVSKEKTLEEFRSIYCRDALYLDVYSSIFSRFCFNLFDEKCSRAFFSKENNDQEDYFDFLSQKYPDLCRRDSAFGIIDVDKTLFSISYEDGCNQVLEAVRYSFEKLNNHCVLGVFIPPLRATNEDWQWKLYSDVILYAEKHRKHKIEKPYFRWKKIATQTCEYIPRIVPYYAEFEFAFEGFVFKDCFVMDRKDEQYDLLLIFEKNLRDERPINCPACRSEQIQGNSYPILNVRSWECKNPLCPDRSKYNRGKRYSFMSLFRQKEMQNDINAIPELSIAKWRLDCVMNASKKEAFEMLIRHYSCVNDEGYIFTNTDPSPLTELHGRKLTKKAFMRPVFNLRGDFKNSSYFYRYIQDNERPSKSYTAQSLKDATIYLGESLDVLRSMDDDCVDGAVTSPPYYNAKSYSQWSNIYCYLFDMYTVFKELYRVMKDSAVLLFNVFDYFDNENNVVLSAMGNKRMILGAYMLDIFERIGFSVQGNIIWHKGEIQGNRSFNQGNLTPYYQAPLNCWEHIIIVSKGTVDARFQTLHSCVQHIKPVIKMVKGKNILGHEAPYPKDIPELLVRCMHRGSLVLDPFLGSGTTSMVAHKYGLASIGIEKDVTYYHLCLKLLTEDMAQQLSLLAME